MEMKQLYEPHMMLLTDSEFVTLTKAHPVNDFKCFWFALHVYWLISRALCSVFEYINLMIESTSLLTHDISSTEPKFWPQLLLLHHFASMCKVSGVSSWECNLHSLESLLSAFQIKGHAPQLLSCLTISPAALNPFILSSFMKKIINHLDQKLAFLDKASSWYHHHTVAKKKTHSAMK